jgi:hypothetical protein
LFGGVRRKAQKCKEMLPKTGSGDPARHPSTVGLTEERLFHERCFFASPQTMAFMAWDSGDPKRCAHSRPAQFRVGAETGIGWLRATGTLLT